MICTKKGGIVMKYQPAVPPGFDGSMALPGQKSPRETTWGLSGRGPHCILIMLPMVRTGQYLSGWK